MRHSIFVVCVWFAHLAHAQLPGNDRYEGPVLSRPTEISYAWHLAVNASADRVAVGFGRWDGAGEVRVFDRESGETLHRFASDIGVRAVAALPGGEQFASGDFDGNLTIRSFQDGEILAQWKTPQSSIEMLTFSADGKECFFCSNGNYAARADAKTGQIKTVYQGHDDNVYFVDLSADGTRLASSAADGEVIVWDVESGQPIHKLSHPGRVNAVRWLGDSLQLVSVSTDHRLCIWDATSGELLREADAGRQLFSVDVDEDASTIVTGGIGDIQFWTAETLERIEYPATAFQGHDSLIIGLQLVGEDRLISAGWDTQGFHWNTETGQPNQVFDVVDKTYPAVVAIAGNRELTSAVVARDDGSLAQVDVATLEPTKQWNLPDGKKVSAITLVGDDDLLVASRSGGIYRQSLNAPQRLAEDPAPLVELESSPIAMTAVGNSKEDQMIYVVTANGKIVKADPRTGEMVQTLALGVALQSALWLDDSASLIVMYAGGGEVARYDLGQMDGPWRETKTRSISLPPNPNSILFRAAGGKIGIEFGSGGGFILHDDSFSMAGRLPGTRQQRTAGVGSADARTILMGTQLGKLSVYRLPVVTSGPALKTTLPMKELRLIAFVDDDRSLRVGSIKSDFTTLSSTDLSVKEKIRRLPPFGIASSARCSQRQYAAIGSWDGTVLLTDMASNDIVAHLPPEEVEGTGQACSVAISDDRTRVVVGSKNGIVRMYQVDPPKLMWESKPLGDPVNEVAISSDDQYVAAGTGDYRRFKEPGLTVLLDARDGTTEHTWTDSQEKVTGVAFRADAGVLVACGNDAVRFYDVKSKQLLHTAREIRGGQRVRFVDATRCCVVSYPGRVQLWDTVRNELVAQYTGHEKPAGAEKEPMVWSMDVSQDGKRIATSDLHGQVYIWPIP